LIDDKFAPIIRKKLKDYNCSIMGIAFAPDDRQRIVSEINQSLEQGAEMIVVAGGMSVDPDDITRVAIADAGAEDVVYGTPVLPGAMFLYGRFGDVPVLGLPSFGK
ncbi:MAG: molybdopterin-binding protein, partial [Desulfobacteraceae bacterium 4572_87]